MSTQNKSKPPTWKLLMCGSISGMCGGAVTHPIDLIKVRAQLHGAKDGFGYGSSHVASPSTRTPNMFVLGAQVVKNEGVLGIYKGLSASLLRQATFIGTKFMMYDILKGALADDKGDLNFIGKIASGLGAGATGAIVGNPADLAMVRMQADGRMPPELRRNYKNGAEAVYRVAQEEGLFTLWRGCAPTVLRGMVITASQFAVYDQSKSFLLKTIKMQDNPTTHMTASIMAAVVAGFTSNPFDVAKSRLQQMTKRKKDGKYPYKGTIDCIIKSVRKEGIIAVYKGLGPTIARQIPLNITRFVVMEQLRRIVLNQK